MNEKTYCQNEDVLLSPGPKIKQNGIKTQIGSRSGSNSPKHYQLKSISCVRRRSLWVGTISTCFVFQQVKH